MKRQTRPFVVEVKKRRVGLEGKRPIWAGIDLTVTDGEVPSPEHGEDTAVQDPAPDVTKPVRTAAGGNQAAPPYAQREEPVEGVGSEAGDGVSPDAAGQVDVAPERVRRRVRRDRDAVSDLPRGQRWKRRLPAVLLRRKKRGA